MIVGRWYVQFAAIPPYGTDICHYACNTYDLSIYICINKSDGMVDDTTSMS